MSKQKFLFFLIPVLLLIGLLANAQGIQVPTSAETGLPDGQVSTVLNTTLNWLLKIFVIIATISFVVTGLQFIFSFGGASGSEAQAKKNFTYTIIALFIVGGSLIILKAVIGLLGPASSGGASSSPQQTNWAQDARNLHEAERQLNNTQNPPSPGQTNWAQDARNLHNAETNSANRSNSYTPGTNWAQDARNLNQAEQQQNNSYINGSKGLTNQDMPQSNF